MKQTVFVRVSSRVLSREPVSALPSRPPSWSSSWSVLQRFRSAERRLAPLSAAATGDRRTRKAPDRSGACVGSLSAAWFAERGLCLEVHAAHAAHAAARHRGRRLLLGSLGD